MANFLMPKGHVMTDDKSASHGADESAVNVLPSDAIFEQRFSGSHGPVGDLAAADSRVVLANAAHDSVTVVDAGTLAPVDTVALGGEPTAVVVSDGRAYVSVAGDSHDAVCVVDLDTCTVLKTYPLASGVTALTVSADGKRVYAGRTTQDRVDVAVIDITAERVGTIEIGRGPAANIDALRVDPSGKRLYVAVSDTRGSKLVVVDAETSRTARVVPVGSPIRDIGLAGGAAYVLTSDRAVGGAVHVIDLATMRTTDMVTVGGAPTQLVTSPDQTRAYVVDFDRVVVLCTLSLDVVDSLKVDARPSCVTPSVDGSRMYVADYAGGVSVFSVESSIEAMYSQFLVTDPIALSVSHALHAPRTLQPVTA